MSAVERAMAGWGEPPDWIIALAKACDETSQVKAAERIGYSGAVVNQVLKRGYRGDLGRVETVVRGAFMAEAVECPGLGTSIPSNECVAWRRRRYDGGNHLNVRMYRACRGGCPHSDLGGGNAQ